MANLSSVNLVSALIICLGSWLIFLRLTWGIKTAVGGGACDNDYMIRVAAKSNEWGWPSDMHIKTYTGTSTSQKDITILLLVLFQKIFRDRKGEFPIVALWSFANSVSAFLVYLIGANYWGTNVGLLVSILYISTFWMWQMSLFVGHLNVGTMFFLLATYFTTLSVNAGPYLTYLWLLTAGISFCCMLFSSSSSLRYLILFFVAVFFSKHLAIHAGFYKTATNNHFLFLGLVITILFTLFLTIIKIFYKKIIAAAYDRKAGILNILISAKKYPLDHYLKRAEGQIPNILRWLIKLYVFIFVVVMAIGFDYFMPILAGFMLIFLILTLPNIKRSFTFYFNYIYISYMKPGMNSGLVRYVRTGYFEKNHIKIPSNLRGGGIGWVPKIFFRMAPFHTLIYLATIIAILTMDISLSQPILSYSSFFALVFVSLLPILWAELTKAYQVSRSYSSGLIGFMILIGTGAFIFQNYTHFWIIAIVTLIATLAWNLWKFFTGIYPARMSFNKIIKTFDKFNIKEIYTYDTLYNQSFFDNAETSPSLKNLKINFIKSIGDVKDGWILIPGTTHKGGYFTEEVVQHGDFNQDPILNELLETKKIEKVANVKFKTIYGSDKIWLQESDIISYLDLIAHDFSEKDRFRGYAWLLHSSKL